MLTLPFNLTEPQKNIATKIVNSINEKNEFTIFKGLTGVGKTAVIASVIDQLRLPTIVLSHNKVLAKQLHDEYSSFFQHDSVDYFISHFEFYQAEAYIPSIDKYFQKETIVDFEIDRQRMKTTRNIIELPFNITVASVSAIFGAGIPLEYVRNIQTIKVGDKITIRDFLKLLITELYYSRVDRNDLEWYNQFSVIGDQITMKTLSNENVVITFDDFENKIESIKINNKSTLELKIYPANFYYGFKDLYKSGIEQILEDLELQIEFFINRGKLVEAQRIRDRTLFDIEMIKEIGYTRGMENYVKYFYPQNLINQRPVCLFDYYRMKYGNKFLTILDESHQTLPQIQSMVKGQLSLKRTLIDFGFRLPSCVYNRPLSYDEFMDVSSTKLFMSATPGKREKELTKSTSYFKLDIRPTGITEPEIIVHGTQYQLDRVVEALQVQSSMKEQSIILTLTIDSAEGLTTYLQRLGFSVVYLHGGIKPKDRLNVFSKIRQGEWDVIIGCQLMKEGIDLPDVSAVFIIDADKEGFLRNETALQQMAGRAARNPNGKVYLFADNMTQSIINFIENTNQAREAQIAYNKENNIVPTVIRKNIRLVENLLQPQKENKKDIEFYKTQLNKATLEEDFELAIQLRDDFKLFYPVAFEKFAKKKDIEL